MSRVLGAVLAGGNSRRFGSDKAMALLDGVTLIDHAMAGLSRFVDDIVICGREIDGRRSLADRPMPGLGPLGGLNAALWWGAENGYRGVLTMGCDTPVLPEGLGPLLIGDDPAFVEGHYLIGWWPSSLAETLEAHLWSSADRSVRSWIRRAGARSVVFTGVVPNINTRAELENLRKGQSQV